MHIELLDIPQPQSLKVNRPSSKSFVLVILILIVLIESFIIAYFFRDMMPNTLAAATVSTIINP
jgi:hypothetical protein